MIYADKLFSLFEQTVNERNAEGRSLGLNGYRRRFREMLGIVEGPQGNARVDLDKREIDPREFSFQDVIREFLPRRFSPSDVPRMMAAAQMERNRIEQMHLTEAEGYVVLPSHFSSISAFNDTAAGLIDAMVIEAYQSEDYNGDDFFDVQDSRVNGGKMIGTMNDGQSGDDLTEGEPYPTVGLKETYVDIPDNKRRGNVIQLNLKAVLYDRTDKIRADAEAAGNATRRLRDQDMGRVFMGITNTYSRDGNASNTYLDARGSIPNDYINSSLNALVDLTDVQNGIDILEGNTDPGTGFEVMIGEPYEVAVMPQQMLTSRSIARTTELEVRTDSATQIRRSASPLFAFEPVKLTRFWFNLLTASGVSAANAQARWWMGKFKRAFKYRQIIPFQTNEAPLSSEDVRRDIIMVRVSLEHGVAFTAEPRYSYMGTAEDITP